MTEIANKLPKGSYAVAHIQSSGYSLLAGTFHYSRYFVVQITKATKDGVAKEYLPCAQNCSRKVDRKATIYAFPEAFKAIAADAFKAQTLDFIGYHDLKELKAALESFAMVPA